MVIGLRFRKLRHCCMVIQACVILHNYAVMQWEFIEYNRNANLDDNIGDNDGFQRPRMEAQV